jgi:hypothetical protein
MAKRQEPPIRVICILVGTMIGCILAYTYQVNMPTLFYQMSVGSLVVFVAIPLLAGFVSGLLHPALAMKNGLYVGFFIGLFNSILTAIKLNYTASLDLRELYSFPLFAIISVFIWMILAAASAALAQRFYD